MQEARACTGDSGAPSFLGRTSVVVGVATGGDSACMMMGSNLRLDTPSARTFLGQYVTLP